MCFEEASRIGIKILFIKIAGVFGRGENSDNNNNNNGNLIFILRKTHVNMIKCSLHESKLSTLVSYPK